MTQVHEIDGGPPQQLTSSISPVGRESIRHLSNAAVN